MKQITTVGIVLNRTEFGEADRIITMLTPEYGKLRLMARGVRREKSKLAGGIELFSVSDITFVKGRGEIYMLISSRLQKHYASIVQDINRTLLGYELTRTLHRATEDELEPMYFKLLQDTYEALDNSLVPLQLISTWFSAQILQLAGHKPSLQSDENGDKLQQKRSYDFNFDHMIFINDDDGRFNSNHIKFLRLLFSSTDPQILARIQDSTVWLSDLSPIVQTMLKTQIRI
jgi:DNA repair protein RecO